MIRKTAFFSLAVAGCGVLAFAFLQGTPGNPLNEATTIVEGGAFAFTGPTNPTSSEISAFVQAVNEGTPLPIGWSVDASEGQMKLVDTGMSVIGSNDRAFTATLIDDAPDLETATIYLDGVAVFTATRSNGSIVERNNMAVATLPVLVPPASQPFELKVMWVASDGVTVREASGLAQVP